MLLRRTSSPTGEGHLTSVSSSKFLPQIKELPEMNFKSLSKVLERPTLYLFPTCAKSAAPSFWLFQKWPTVHPISLYFFLSQFTALSRPILPCSGLRKTQEARPWERETSLLWGHMGHAPHPSRGRHAHRLGQSGPEKPLASWPLENQYTNLPSFLNIKAPGKLVIPAYSSPLLESRCNSCTKNS